MMKTMILQQRQSNPEIERQIIDSIFLVSEQPTIPSDTHKNVKNKHTFGRIIKSRHVKELLQKQEQKDKNYENYLKDKLGDC